METEALAVIGFMALVALWYLKSEIDQLKNLISKSG
jgi:hypothetical protein